MSYDIYGRIATGRGREAEAFYAGNYTSNCSPMWTLALNNRPLASLDGMSCAEAESLLRAAVERMEQRADECRALNPSNGWGNYEEALEYLRKIRKGCTDHPWRH